MSCTTDTKNNRHNTKITALDDRSHLHVDAVVLRFLAMASPGSWCQKRAGGVG